MQHKEDYRLVQRLLGGDEQEFTRFYNVYFPRVYRFCKARVESEDTCNDIVQQSMINSMNGLANYRGEASLYTWLCQIARNEMYGWFKKHGRKEQLNSSIDENASLIAAIESIPSGIEGEKLNVHDDGVAELVQLSLDSLPSAYGKVLELKYVEGLSVSEIAEAMESGEVAIQSLLARARKAFKSVFDDLQKDNTRLA